MLKATNNSIHDFNERNRKTEKTILDEVAVETNTPTQSKTDEVIRKSFFTPGYPERSSRKIRNNRKATYTEPPIGSLLSTPPDKTPIRVDGITRHEYSPKMDIPKVNLGSSHKMELSSSRQNVILNQSTPSRIPDKNIEANIQSYLTSVPNISSARAKPITPPRVKTPVYREPIDVSGLRLPMAVDFPSMPSTPIYERRIPNARESYSEKYAREFRQRRTSPATPEKRSYISPAHESPIHETHRRKEFSTPKYFESQEPVKEKTQEEIESDKVNDAKTRADYRVKFGILREAYPSMNIPEPDEKQSIEEIKVAYKQYVKRIHIDTSVEQNKIYLLILWLIIEVAGSRLLKQPGLFSGYTKYQFKYMKKYQMILIELGEDSYVDGVGSSWPPYMRLLAMALFNGVVFVLVQLLANRVGTRAADPEKLSEMIMSFLTQNKGEDVLKRAESATSDNPPPPATTQEATPPLGNIGNLLATFASAFTGGGGGGLGSLFGGGGDDNSAPKTPAMRRPTTFASRRNRNKNENES